MRALHSIPQPSPAAAYRMSITKCAEEPEKENMIGFEMENADAERK
jgi:hypothetical protein